MVLISCLSLGFGRLGDLVGRKKLYKLGMALYPVGAGLAVLVQSFPQLLYARGVMALGLAMAAPMSAAIVVSAFPIERRGVSGPAHGLGFHPSAFSSP